LSENKDLYSILGLLPDAEPELIRAVYLALAKKYHPDSSGNSDNEDKLKEINAAYGILSDPTQRKKYDATRSDQNDPTGQYEPDVDDEDLSVDDYQEDWAFAVQYRPELEDLLNEIATISPTLSIVFQSTVLSNKAFNKAEQIKDDLISVFIERYFGSTVDIQEFAKSLLRNKKMVAAKELNRAVRIFGETIDSSTTISKICIKYKLGGNPWTYHSDHVFEPEDPPDKDKDESVWDWCWKWATRFLWVIGLLFLLLLILSGV